MERPRVTLCVNRVALQPTSSRKCRTPKDNKTPGINLKMMVKTLTKSGV